MFSSKNSENHLDGPVIQDEFKTVEPSVNFRQITCYVCDHTAIYRFNTKQIRRNPVAPEDGGNQEILMKWKAIPRFAEIPEVIKCENCGEVLGSYPEIIY